MVSTLKIAGVFRPMPTAMPFVMRAKSSTWYVAHHTRVLVPWNCEELVRSKYRPSVLAGGVRNRGLAGSNANSRNSGHSAVELDAHDVYVLCRRLVGLQGASHLPVDALRRT